MLKKTVAVLFLPLILTAADIYMAGDSTMSQYTAKRYPQAGWGMALPEFCRSGVTVINRATGGRSSMSFISEKRWEGILRAGKSGDFVIIQFGHNDAEYGEKIFTGPLIRKRLFRYILKFILPRPADAE